MRSTKLKHFGIVHAVILRIPASFFQLFSLLVVVNMNMKYEQLIAAPKH